MILNLNPMSFRDFGTVPSERSDAVKKPEKHGEKTLELQKDQVVIRLARSDTKISCAAGSSVLLVSLDGKDYMHFYMDKTAYIKAGVYFGFSPFMGDASVFCRAQTEPEIVGTRMPEQLQMRPKLRVEGLYTFFYQEKEQGFLFPGEAHPILELIYVDQGSLHSVVDGQDTLLQKGDIAIYGPNQWHMQYADIGVAPRFVTISFDLSGGDFSPLLNRKLSAPQHAVTLLHKMLRELEQMNPYFQDVIIAEMDMLLLILLREVASPTAGKLQASNSVHSENEIIRQAQQFISTHIREKLSVPYVARQVDVSPSYLTALFHKNLQISPGEYIRRIKLQESKQMIRENNLNFTEIAAELQYSTVHHFSRQFKEKFGITPTEYAKSVR